MQEIWKEVKDHDGYFVSNMGRVMSSRRYSNGEKTIVKPRKHNRGYVNVNIDGKNRYIHRLVAEAFIPNPDNLPQVNHINEIKDDNRVSNLEWISNADNAAYGTRVARVAAKNSIPVMSIEISSGKVTRHVSGHAAARETGAFQGNVHKVLSGKYKQTCGYIFIYESEYLS